MGLVRKVRFADGFKNWQRNNFLEKRGRKKLPLQMMQIISKVWYENSIPSVDCRNGRESVAIRKSLYAQRYHADLYHEQPLIEKKTLRIVTCTNPKIVNIIKEEYDLSLPVGTVWYYKPFYISNPTEKEKLLCMCQFCLNMRLLFEVLRSKYGEIGDSLSEYLMGECDCAKNENGFWQIKCCTGKCSSCKTK